MHLKTRLQLGIFFDNAQGVCTYELCSFLKNALAEFKSGDFILKIRAIKMSYTLVV